MSRATAGLEAESTCDNDDNVDNGDNGDNDDNFDSYNNGDNDDSGDYGDNSESADADTMSPNSITRSYVVAYHCPVKTVIFSFMTPSQ